MEKIKLGDKVKDVVTGFEGIADGKFIYLTYGTRFSVQPPMDKDGNFIEAKIFDEHQLVVVETQAIKIKSK